MRATLRDAFSRSIVHFGATTRVFSVYPPILTNYLISLELPPPPFFPSLAECFKFQKIFCNFCRQTTDVQRYRLKQKLFCEIVLENLFTITTTVFGNRFIIFITNRSNLLIKQRNRLRQFDSNNLVIIIIIIRRRITLKRLVICS